MQDPDAKLLVACLCAEWCGTCREYRAVFDAAEARHAEHARFGWVDIEDEPDVPGTLDIETFPTLLISRGDAVLFYGPLTPQTGVLTRTIEKALAGDLSPVADPILVGLPARTRAALGI